MREATVIVVGAGPIGLELAVALKRADVSYIQVEASQIAETIYRFPPQMRFFSSAERISIAGVPIPRAEQSRCAREDYLAYLRSVAVQFDLEVNTYERVIDIIPRNGEFEATTENPWKSRRSYRAPNIVLATGGTSRPRELGIRGEDLPHASHRLEDPHRYFRRRVLVIGGRNSAVEAALRCYHAGAEVTVSYRGVEFPESVKYWLRPEINMLIRTGRIHGHFETVATVITPDHVALKPTDGGDEIYVPADHVLLMIGYEADMSLFELAGVKLCGTDHRPVFDEQTMETNVAGVYVAGTACAGSQTRFAVFLENCHVHVGRIVASLTGAVPPAAPPIQPEPES